jgi:hypothetical protein
MNKSILFAWLDEAVELTLNPDKGYTNQLQDKELFRLQEKFGSEVWLVFGHLKTQVFWAFSPKKRKAILRQYDQAIKLLIKQAVFNEEGYAEDSQLKVAGKVIIDYLNELSYAVENRFGYFADPIVAGDSQPSGEMHKLFCDLSVDQIGILLKAADDTKLLVSRSLSMIFKLIVPYLSTRNKKDLSWDSMRSNSYHPEEKDKEVAIAALEKLILKIKEQH